MIPAPARRSDPAPAAAPPVFAYGFLGLPLAFAALPLYVHLPRFYAERTELSLALLGALLLAARLFDAVIDPWLGWLADRLPRRLMLAAALPLFAAGFAALLHPPPEMAAAWLLGSLAITYLGHSAATVAHQAWGASAAADSAARTRLTAAREGCALAGVVLAAVLPHLLDSDPAVGTARLSWVLPPLLLVAAALGLPRIGAGHAPGTPAPRRLAASLRQVWAVRAFRRLLAVFVLNGVAAALPATLFLFFVADVIQAEAAAGPLLALYFVAGAASLPVWVGVARRLGRVRAWVLAMGLAVFAFAGSGALGPGDLLPFALICGLSGLALGADLALPAAIAADLGARSGHAGALFGVWNLAGKLTLALAAGLSLPLLDGLGYQPGGAHGLAPLVFTYALLPLGCKLLAAALLWRWRVPLEIRS